MSGKALIELSKNYLIYKPISNKFMKTLKRSEDEELKINLASFKDINIDICKKRLSILIDGEEIYIKLFNFPKSIKNNLYNAISCELKFRFKNIDNIMFTYSILKCNKDTIDVLVFCMNSVKLDVLKKTLNNKLNIKAIYPIQFYALNRSKKYIKEDNYLFVFLYEEDLYILACRGKYILCSELVKDFNEDEFLVILKEFEEKCISKGMEKINNKLYFSNFPYKDKIKNLSSEICCEDLGKFNIREYDGG